MKILLVDGTIIGTKTGVILEQVKDYIEEVNPEYTLEIIRLSNYEHQFVDGRPFENYNDDMKLLVSKFDQADGFIIASPIFQGSIPGVLKNTFDFFTPNPCAINLCQSLPMVEHTNIILS